MSASIPSKQVKGIPYQSHQQSQSLLFSLPVELRLKIFELALDLPPIPLAIIDLPTGGQRLTLVTPGVGGPAVKSIRAQRVLSLPLSCMRASAEVLPLLYSKNLFAIYDPAIIPVFSRSVHAPLIRRLDFCWTRSKPPPNQPTKKKRRFGGLLSAKKEKTDRWEEVWKAMASFEGLQWIRLEISIPYTWTPEWKQREQELLTPLKGILKHGAEGELTLTWEKAGRAGENAEDFLPEWSIKRRPWGAGFDEFPSS